MNYPLGPVPIVETFRGQVVRDALSEPLVICAAARVVGAVGGHLARALGLGGHEVTCRASLRVSTRGLTSLTRPAPHQTGGTHLVRNLGNNSKVNIFLFHDSKFSLVPLLGLQNPDTRLRWEYIG